VHTGQRSFEPVESIGERMIACSRLELEHRLLRRGPSDRVHDPSRGHDATPAIVSLPGPVLNT